MKLLNPIELKVGLTIVVTIVLTCTLAVSGCNGNGTTEQTDTPGAAENRKGTPKEKQNVKIDPQLEQFVSEAVSDLARRLEIDEQEIEIVEAQFVTWPNSALGCPEPDMMYTQALVPGYRVRLSADGHAYHYHGASDKPPFHCPAERVSAPAATGSDESRDVR
ncbi:MAG: hypothetical protein WD397_05270 [Wenzhouxiangellaceae bacterium]